MAKAMDLRATFFYLCKPCKKLLYSCYNYGKRKRNIEDHCVWCGRGGEGECFAESRFGRIANHFSVVLRKCFSKCGRGDERCWYMFEKVRAVSSLARQQGECGFFF